MRWDTVGGSGRSAARATTVGAVAAIATTVATRRPVTVMAAVSPEFASLETGLWQVRSFQARNAAPRLARQDRIDARSSSGLRQRKSPTVIQICSFVQC